MSKIFKENIKGLSSEYQEILLDDLVTAFQNRLVVLMRSQRKRYSESPQSVLDLDARLSKARELMTELKPVKLRLKKGMLVRLSKELYAKKIEDEKIELYEVIE
jgi:hypothetical protein